jgi:outer membrane protein assembly factor BamB
MRAKISLRLVVLSVIFTFGVCDLCCGQIKSQWRGPNRDGIYPEHNLLKKWPDTGPKLIWTVDVLGTGFSSIAVTSDRIYTCGMLDSTGFIFSYDLKGNQLWKKAYGKEWSKGNPGTRGTPVVVDDRVYIISGRGKAVCLNADTGDIIWSVDLVEKFGTVLPDLGMCESALIDGDHIICTTGGPKAIMVALNRQNGSTIWVCEGNGEKSSYCSPSLIKIGNTRLIVTMVQKSIIGVDADAGKLLWSHKQDTKYDVNANSPIYKDGSIYCSTGYELGGVKLKLSPEGKSITEVWRDKELDSQFHSYILLDGYIFGSGHRNKGWKCLNWDSGEIMYSSKELGTGNVIYADGLLYCYTEKGVVALVEPTPKAFKLISKFKIEHGSGPHWAHMVIKDKILYVRHGDTLMAYAIGD